MSHHAGVGELKQARSVIERGVKHVAFAGDRERQNCWVAYMNLELEMGSEETFQTIMKRAIQHNDAEQICSQVWYELVFRIIWGICSSTVHCDPDNHILVVHFLHM